MMSRNHFIKFAILVMSFLPAIAQDQPARTPVSQPLVEAAIKASGVQYMSMFPKGKVGFELQLQGDINFLVEIDEGTGIRLTAKLYKEKGNRLEDVNLFNLQGSRTGKLLSCAYFDEAGVPTNQHFLLIESEVSSTLISSAIRRFVSETYNLSGFLATKRTMAEMMATKKAPKKK